VDQKHSLAVVDQVDGEQDAGKKESTPSARRRMQVQIKAYGSGDGQGGRARGRRGLMKRECAPTQSRRGNGSYGTAGERPQDA
jgi:hypothetical protein